LLTPGAYLSCFQICLDHYRRESAAIFLVFGESGAVVERASIDEAYFDLTLLVRQTLLDRFPALRSPPSGNLDAPLPSPEELGAAVDWSELGNLIPFDGQKPIEVKAEGAAKEEEGVKEEEGAKEVDAGKEVTGECRASHRRADEQEEEKTLTAERAKETSAVKEEEGETLNCDLSRNLPSPGPTSHSLSAQRWSWRRAGQFENDLGILAARGLRQTAASRSSRLAGRSRITRCVPSSSLFPQARECSTSCPQTILCHSSVPAFLINLPFRKMRNFGGAFGKAVAETYQAELVGDLLCVASTVILTSTCSPLPPSDRSLGTT
jgi:DNA polymerase eta